MDNVFKAYYESDIGVLQIVGTREAVISIQFAETSRATDSPLPSCMEKCLAQLEEYFRGSRKRFSFPTRPRGTPFQMRVWEELARIPYGSTVSYKEIARAVGNEKAVRAVGGANGRNKLTIVIPCHRVIAHDGGLGGYGGGLWRKEWLLEHERRNKG